MAKVERTFHMDHAPEQAQALFLRDVGPALAQDGEFLLQHETPGELRFSQGDVAAGPGPSEEPSLLTQQDIEQLVDDAIPRAEDAVPLRGQVAPSGLTHIFARHIKVGFAPDGEGTRVEIEGHAEHALRDAIERLGTPGHWPETADDPHD